MRACLVVIACLCLAASLPAGPVPADTPADRAPSASVSARDTVSAAAPETVAVAPARNPVMMEVRAALDREREQIAALRARLGRTADHRAALALQREIERVKLETEVAILRIQASAAREAGHAAVAARLDAAIENLLAPPAPAEPVKRPAPRAPAR